MYKILTILVLYALSLLAGGVMGYLKGSLVSLMMGGLFSFLLLLSTWPIYQGKRWGYYFALSLTFLIAAVFSFKFVRSPAFFPSGLFCILSLFMLGVLVRGLNSSLKKSFP